MLSNTIDDRIWEGRRRRRPKAVPRAAAGWSPAAKKIIRLTKSLIFLKKFLLSPCYYSQDAIYLHTWPQKWRVIHHLFWDFLLLRADIRRQICVACQPGYSCHNALQYIRYVRGHIHFVPYITIGKRNIHKFFPLAERGICHVWGLNNSLAESSWFRFLRG